MSVWAGLIERLEKATEGSRELDGEIAKLLGWRLWRSKHGYWNVDGPNGETYTTECDPFGPQFDPETGKKNPDYDREPAEDWVERMDIPAYTSSLDAALTLVPTAFYWLHARGRKRPTEPMYAFQILDPDNGEEIAIAEHEQDAICICIAALKARVSHGVDEPE